MPPSAEDAAVAASVKFASKFEKSRKDKRASIKAASIFPESSSSASKGKNRCHTPASVHGICFMPFEGDLFMASMNLSISQFCMSKAAISFSLFLYHHLPLIGKIGSKSKQFRLMFRTAKIDSKSKQI